MKNGHRWSAEDITDQSNKAVIITGANSGIGFEAARALAGKGAEVIMACRNLEKGETAADQIRREYPQANLLVMALDLADLRSVAEFAASYKSTHSSLDILINNAGVMAIPYRKTADGFEMQFGTNHLGHFALTDHLMDLLIETAGSRVVTVSSYVHHIGRINFGDLNSERWYQKWLAYGQSKLANLLFGFELQRKLESNGRNPISVTVHPGYAATNLQNSTGFFTWLNPIMAQSAEMGALPTLYAAVADDIQGGEYVGPDGFLGQHGYPKIVTPSKRARDEQAARELWTASEHLTGLKFGI